MYVIIIERSLWTLTSLPPHGESLVVGTWVEFVSPRVFIEEVVGLDLQGMVRLSLFVVDWLHGHRTRYETRLVVDLTLVLIKLNLGSICSSYANQIILFDTALLVRVSTLQYDRLVHQVSFYDADEIGWNN